MLCKKTPAQVVINPDTQHAYLGHIYKAFLFNADSLYSDACREFEASFSYRHDDASTLFACAQVYDKVKDTAHTLQYIRLCSEAGMNWYGDKGLFPYLRSTGRYPTQEQYDQYRAVFLSHINREYFDTLEQMQARDQAVRKAGGQAEEMVAVDSADMEQLKRLVERYGYPTYASVGYQGEADAFVLLLHGLFDGVHDSADWAYYQPLLLRQVQEAGLMPLHYAWLYDRVVSYNSKGETCYGVQVVWQTDGTMALAPIYDIAHVDERRKEIGMEPLSEDLHNMHMKAPDGYVGR